MKLSGGTDRVKVGVAGFGYWGPKLVRNFSEIPEADMAWVVDRDETRLAKARSQYPGLEVGTDYDRMLASDVEAVVVATPIRTHYPLARAALLAGKHVLVEKPLTAASAEAEELTRLAETSGLTLMVGHTFIYNNAVRLIREIVSSGEIGDVCYVDTARLNLGLFQNDINVVWDLAPHDISVLLYILGQEPIRVSARGKCTILPNIHDVAYIEFRFQNDLLAHSHLSWLDPCKVRRVTIVGTKKMVVYNDVQDTEKVRIYDKGIQQPYETDRFNDFHLTYRYGSVTIPHIPLQEPLNVQCRHFLECIRTGSRPMTDGHSGLQVVRILEAIDQSLARGGATLPVPATNLNGLTPEPPNPERPMGSVGQPAGIFRPSTYRTGGS
jgi:predicted dehydrogenase